MDLATAVTQAAQSTGQGLTFEVETELFIAAPATRVWQALTTEVDSWWPHSFSDSPHAIVLEPRIGGRFYEAFDEQGNGALFATVTYCEPPRMLKYIGTMGMRNPVLNQSTLELEETAGGTLVKKRMEVFGVVAPAVAQSYQQGSGFMLTCLKTWVETGVKGR